MDKKIIRVPIDEQDSAFVEGLFYESSVLRNLFKTIFSLDIEITESKRKYLDDLKDQMVQADIALETAKATISQKYLPEGFEDIRFNYTFDFEKAALVYEGILPWEM